MKGLKIKSDLAIVASNFWSYSDAAQGCGCWYRGQSSHRDSFPIDLLEKSQSFNIDESPVYYVSSDFYNFSFIIDSLTQNIFTLQNKKINVFENNKDTIIEEIKKCRHEFPNLNKHKNEITSAGKLDKLQIILTDSCNLSCVYCSHFRSENEFSKNKWSATLIRKLLGFINDSVDKHKELEIIFFGGEPLLEFENLRLISDFISSSVSNVNYSLVTNGTLLDDQMITELKSKKFKVTVSVDLPPAEHDKNRNESFLTARNAVFSLLRAGVDVSIRPTYYSSNQRSLYDVFKLQKKYFPELEPVSASGLDINSLGILKSSYLQNQFFDSYENDFLNNKHKRPCYSSILHMLGSINVDKCSMLSSGVTIASDGGIYPCHSMRNLKFKLGCINAGINEKKRTSLIKELNHAQHKCEECWAVDMCQGFCHKVIIDGQPKNVIDWYCFQNKNQLIRGIRLMELMSTKRLTILMKDVLENNFDEIKKALNRRKLINSKMQALRLLSI